jgi:hypothetical protein
VNTVQKIGNDAFLNSGITGLTFASSQNLTSIGDNAFKGCEDLVAPTLPASLTTIGTSAFEGCTNADFDEIIIPARVASIGVGAFRDAASLAALTFTGTSALNTISESAFENTALADVELPASVVNIDSKAFAGTGLTLTEITINGVLASVAADALPDECESVILKATPDENMAFPVSVTKLTLMLAAGVKVDNVPGVTELTLAGTSKAALKTLTGIDTLYLADGFLPAEPLTGADFGDLKLLAVIEVNGASLAGPYAAVGNVLFSGTTNAATAKTLIKYPAGLNDDSYAIPTGTIFIGDAAFKDANSLLGQNSGALTFGGAATVKSIGNNAFENLWIETITFPSTLETIGNEAFMNSKQLDGVITLPASLKDIGLRVFAGTSIDGLVVASALETLGAGALPASCVALTLNSNLSAGFVGDFGSIESLTIGPLVTAIADNAFANKTSLESLTIEASSTLATIGEGAFMNTKVIEVEFNGAALRSIGKDAFKGVTTLTTLTLTNAAGTGATGTVIGESAFEGCIALVAGTGGSAMPLAGVTSIGAAAFKDCKVASGSAVFTDITIPITVGEIGANAFYNSDLTNLVVTPTSATLAKIGDGAFYGTKLSGTVDLTGAPISTIGTIPEAPNPVGAFEGLTLVTGVTLTTPAAALVIGANAFKNTGLTAMPTLGTTTTIGAGAFEGCASLAAPAVIDFTVTSIGAGAFKGCGASGFDTITIPNAVTAIGDDTFNGCTSLATVTLGNGITSIGANAFTGTAITALSIGSPLASIAATSLPNAALLPTGVALTLTANLATSFSGSFGNISSLTIAAGVSAINANAFRGNANLKVLTFNNAATIPAGTFTDCSNLKEVNIGAALSTAAVNNLPAATETLALTINAGSMSFANANIKNLIIGNGSSTATTFGVVNFYQLSGLVKVTFKGDETPGNLDYAVPNGSFRLGENEISIPNPVNTLAGGDVSYGYAPGDPTNLTPNGGWSPLP